MIPCPRNRFHHRSSSFSSLLKKAETTMQDQFGLHDYEFFFVPGSGTLVNEMVACSLKEPLRIEGRGKFTERLKSQLVLYEKFSPVAKGSAGVTYETSLCKYNTKWYLFADMVSAFPYYLPTASIWTTVSGKQLGALPGIGIIAVKKDCWSLIGEETESFLSIRKWRRYKKLGQTPYTPAAELIEDLIENAKKIHLDTLRKTVKDRRKLLGGKQPPPVMFLDAPNKIVEKYGLYTGSGRPQVFLYAGMDQTYQQLARDLKC